MAAREPPPAWLAVWRFRLVALVALLLVLALGVLAVRQLTGGTAQDPDVDAFRPPLSAERRG